MVTALIEIGDLLPTDQKSAVARESSRALSMYPRRLAGIYSESSDRSSLNAVRSPAPSRMLNN